MANYISAHLCLANLKQEVMLLHKEQQQKIKAIIIY